MDPGEASTGSKESGFESVDSVRPGSGDSDLSRNLSKGSLPDSDKLDGTAEVKEAVSSSLADEQKHHQSDTPKNVSIELKPEGSSQTLGLLGEVEIPSKSKSASETEIHGPNDSSKSDREILQSPPKHTSTLSKLKSDTKFPPTEDGNLADSHEQRGLELADEVKKIESFHQTSQTGGQILHNVLSRASSLLKPSSGTKGSQKEEQSSYEIGKASKSEVDMKPKSDTHLSIREERQQIASRNSSSRIEVKEDKTPPNSDEETLQHVSLFSRASSLLKPKSSTHMPPEKSDIKIVETPSESEGEIIHNVLSRVSNLWKQKSTTQVSTKNSQASPDSGNTSETEKPSHNYDNTSGHVNDLNIDKVQDAAPGLLKQLSAGGLTDHHKQGSIADDIKGAKSAPQTDGNRVDLQNTQQNLHRGTQGPERGDMSMTKEELTPFTETEAGGDYVSTNIPFGKFEEEKFSEEITFFSSLKMSLQNVAAKFYSGDVKFASEKPQNYNEVAKVKQLNSSIRFADEEVEWTQSGNGETGSFKMAVPPGYGDLGKSARDLFSKGFNYGFFKLEAKTKTASNVEFTANGSSNHDSGKVNGSLETKYKWKDYGMTFSEKWNTDNSLGTEVTVEDQLIQGLKLAFDAQFSPITGKKNGKIKTSYKQDYVNASCDVDFDFAGPTVHGSLVTGYEGWLAGYQMAFDTSKSKLAKNNFALGYKTDDFTLHTAVNDGTEFAGSVFQKVSDKLDMGVQLTWNTGSSATRFGIAGKYCPDDVSTFRAKVNNNSQLGLSFQHQIKDGVTLTLSSLVEGKNFNAGGHKVGLGIDFEA